jgi:hypothetical protein
LPLKIRGYGATTTTSLLKTLQLDIKSVTVHHVESVTYGKSSFPVERRRSVKQDLHDPRF